MKCKERLCITFLLFVFCIIVILEVQRIQSYSASELNFGLGLDDRNGHRFLQRHKLNNSNYSSKIQRKRSEDVDHEDQGDVKVTGKYLYEDVDKLFELLTNYNSKIYDFQNLKNTSFKNLIESFHKRIPKGRFLPKMPLGNKSWERFWRGIHQTALYDPHETDIDGLLRDLTNDAIISTKQFGGGTQVKILLRFKNGGLGLFKPMRFSRDVETIPDHYYFSDYERHHAEIAAFHLDRVMGFYRVPPTAGRLVNLSSEIKHLAERKLRKSFFYSPVDNLCFYSDCSYYCDTNHAICGNPDMKEGSIQAIFPNEKIAERITWKNPWRRSYSKREKAAWEVNNDHCELNVKDKPPFNKYRRLLELIDMHIFDFLGGNMDRHHYETFRVFGNNTFYLHYDNGRAFGKTKYDEMSILAPLYQCCQISFETFTKLAKLYLGPEHLSKLMRESLSHDSLNPILIEGYLKALDRRVAKILKEVYKCISDGYNISDVIVDKTWKV